MSGIDGEELRDLVSSTIDNIQQGMKNRNHHLSGCIEFEVAVVNMQKVEGGIKLFVVDASGKRNTENVTKIKFKVEKDIPLGGSSVAPVFFG